MSILLELLLLARWLLMHVDLPSHVWVVGHLNKVVRDLVFEIGISNISITLGCAGWALCTSILLSDAMDEKSGTVSYETSRARPKGAL